MDEIDMSRHWAMPNKDTFSIKPIGDFVRRYTLNGGVIIDPFARNCTIGTYTNDINPNTDAQYHMRALEFLQHLDRAGVVADVILFDPPYSLRQAKEVYEQYGEWKFTDTQQVGVWTKEKDLCRKLLRSGGYFLHFGWHTNGLGKKRNAVIVELMVVAHGRAHNDTLCIAEEVL